jgi:hypothetical protein
MWESHLILLTFPEVCPLELGEGILAIVGVGCGRLLQIVLDALSLTFLSVLWTLRSFALVLWR